MPETTAEALAPSTRVIYATFDYVGEHKARIAAWLAAVAVLAVLASGIHVVKKEERAVLTRFGKVVDAEVRPGIHYAFPIIEQAHVRKVMRIARRNVATRDGDNVSFSILSGDTNLFEVDVALQYRIGNLKSYLYATVDPETVLALVVRERLIGIMGRTFIDLIFTNNRDVIQARLFDDAVNYLEANDIGIELLALNIVDLRPIDETVAAFRDVSDAIAESIEAVSNANTRKERLLARSRGQAEAVAMNAGIKARERRLQAESGAQAFSDLLDAYRSQPSSVTVTRYWQRMRSIFRDATLSAVNPGDASVIDINMIEGFVPGVGGVPGMPVAAAAPRESLAGARVSLSTASEKRGHGLEDIESDRFLVSGRFHSSRSERDHLGIANPRSLLFDDLSIFSHRHVAPTSVAAAAVRNEAPMVARTSSHQGEKARSDSEGSKEDKKKKKGEDEEHEEKKEEEEEDEEHKKEKKDAGDE